MNPVLRIVKRLWFKGEWVGDMIFAMLACDWQAKEAEGGKE
jgi:hypothetical protein